jgi:ethanolamine ammonia-lyase small subunit
VSCFDIAFAVVDGLSALAVQRHGAPLLAEVLAQLNPAVHGVDVAAARWRIAPVAVVEQGRVAVGDPIGELLDADIVVVLIGERPGLSSPDSLGIYFTWAPRPGRNDAERNCISNVRPEGLGYAEAATRLVYLLEQARSRQLTGVGLKDESGASVLATEERSNFLLAEG